MTTHLVRKGVLSHLPLALLLTALLSGLDAGKAIAQPTNTNPPGTTPDDHSLVVTPGEALSKFASPLGQEYTIGEGDEIAVQVAGRPELSGNQSVGPDGRITLPIVGSIEIRDLTREEAARKLSESLDRYYTSVDVTVRVAKYGPIRILVLGRVEQPGAIYFEGTPTLLDVLSKSRRAVLGGTGNQASLFPKRCAIFRGKDQAVWIDLKSTTENGSAESDIRLRRNDIVFIPDDEIDQISVLGEVQRPGMVRLGAKTTLSEVIALTGGLTASAGAAKIEIIRPGSRTTQEIAFKDLLDTKKNVEVSLQRDDIIYVQRGGFAKFTYFLQQIAPVSSMLMFGAAVK